MRFKFCFVIYTVILSHNIFANCDVETKTFVTKDKFSVQVEEYRSTRQIDKLVIIIPPTGGVNFIDRSYAKYFCNNSLNSLIITRWSNDNEMSFDLEIHKRFYSRAQKAIDLVITNNSKQKISILGTSVGALHSAIALARIDNIKKAFLIVGGGNIAEIIATTDQKILLQAKSIRFKKHSYKNNQEYIKAINNILPYEPLKMRFERSTKKVGMSISSNDLTVPSINQHLLVRAWKPSLLLSTSFGHKTTVVLTWLFNKDRILNFFN